MFFFNSTKRQLSCTIKHEDKYQHKNKLIQNHKITVYHFTGSIILSFKNKCGVLCELFQTDYWQNMTVK